eukprot:NODE_6215_length_464_cov_262.592771_g4706_i0.p1 GENE.NODE_6215_length_464_cov_262.592771_g4706_i0~~NODE_6215_length_464_cov_262.592771_g4706_i0.p1  ORF type:complete len:111 (-),score=38.01 NODE_6215_length_464_cov_262.592771_g4706_i0:132-443(-)
MLCGGTGDAAPADAEIQAICDEVKEAALAKAKADGWNGDFSSFTAVTVKKQVVAGTNYFVKVKVSDSEHAHIRIFKALPHTNQGPQVAGIQMGKGADDELAYF